MRMACFGLLLCGLLTFPNVLLARDIFVDNVTGDDRNDGSRPTAQANGIGPCRTITRALKFADKGDRIILAKTERPYRESITLQGGRHSGVESSPFVIIGNGAILDGTEAIDKQAWRHVRGDIFRFRPDYLTSQQLFLDGRPVQRVSLDDEPAMDDLEPLQWGLHRGYIYFRTEADRIPHQYDLSHSQLHVGVALYAVRQVQIVDLVIQGFVLDGINAHDSVFESTVTGSISRGNGRSGVSVGGACRLQLDACLIGNNGHAQVRGEGLATIDVVNCDIIDEDPLAPAFKWTAKAEILIDGAPLSD